MESTGNDFEKIITETEKKLIKDKIVVIQLWLKLSSPWIDFPVNILRRKKYFFGGLLPQWFKDDGDGLLMQKTIEPPFGKK